MDLSSSPPPPPGIPGLSLSPAHKHHGHITVLKSAGPPGGGGDFSVDSFFDVFFDITIEDDDPVPMLLQLRMQKDGIPAPDVPEPASLAICSLLGVVGIAIGWRRRRKAA